MIRLLPSAAADGATNMAADEALLRLAAAGFASLRFYEWSPATLSLGYFQPHNSRFSDSNLGVLPFVRRPSGGATLVHHHELTYALALPPGSPWQSRESWLVRMHRIITAALAEFGFAKHVQLVSAATVKHGDVLCFQQFTPGDVLCAGRKIVGSAQRKHRQAMLQHGSILLAQSVHTPSLPGIRELTGVSLSSGDLPHVIQRAFTEETDWSIEAGDWSVDEKRSIEELIRTKYATTAWNERR